MGLVDGFARGISLGNSIHQSQAADEDRRLQRIQAQKDSAYQEWARAETKRKTIEGHDLKVLNGYAYRVSEDPKALMTPDELKVARKYDPVIDEYMKLDDNGLKAQARSLDVMAKRFSGQFVPKTDLVAAGNTVYDKQIGEGKSIDDFYPSPDGKGLVFSLGVNNKDGSTSRQPLTKYRLTEADGDNQVKVIPISAFADDVQKRTKLIHSLNAMRVSLGDNSPITAAQKAATLKDKREYDAKIARAQADAEMKKLKEEYRLKGVLENDKQKNRVSLAAAKGSGTTGKTDLIKLKTGKSVTMNDARQAYLAAYGKPDGMGGFSIDTSAPRFDQWLNSQAVEPVFSATVDPAKNEELYQKARAQAEQEAKDRAGYFSSDKSDFSQDGGSRANFIERRTKELMQTYTGGSTTAPTGGLSSVVGTGDYGLREDGTQKGSGFLGEIPTADGRVMTELSIGVNIDGKETLIPSIVPTLTKEEIQYLASGGKPNDEIVKKAVDYARQRMSQGLSPFKQEGEKPAPDMLQSPPKEQTPLDRETAIKILNEAKGDKSLARKLALERGYSL